VRCYGSGVAVEPAGAANGREPAADDGRVDAADEALARELAERARVEGLSLTGPGGLLGRLTQVWNPTRCPRATCTEHDP
jgi:hypothetical protein